MKHLKLKRYWYINGNFNIIFKNKKNKLDKININPTILLGINATPFSKEHITNFFTSEGEIILDHFKPIGEHVHKHINSNSNYLSPTDDKIGFLEEELLKLTFSHYQAAKELYKKPSLYFSGGFLLHLSLECFLKACCLFKNNKFPATHSLENLIQEARIKLRKKIIITVKELDKHHFLRYQYDEAGSLDLEKFKLVFYSILAKMPKRFQKIKDMLHLICLISNK